MWNNEPPRRDDAYRTEPSDDRWDDGSRWAESGDGAFRYSSDTQPPGEPSVHEFGDSPSAEPTSGRAGSFISGLITGIIGTIVILGFIAENEPDLLDALVDDGQWEVLGPASPGEPIEITTLDNETFSLVVHELVGPLEPDPIYIPRDHDRDDDLYGVNVTVTNTGEGLLRERFRYSINLFDADGQEMSPYFTNALGCDDLKIAGVVRQESSVSGCFIWSVPSDTTPDEMRYVDNQTNTQASWRFE